MPGPSDSSFTLLPPDPGVMTADLALDAALAPVIELGAAAPQPIGRGWAFDFVAGDFVYHGRAPARVSDVEQIRVWIEKTLRTARFAHPIYTSVYGIEEPYQLVGRVYDGELVSSYQDAIVDALTVHDRIAAVDSFSYAHDPMTDVLYVSFKVTLDAPAEQQIEVSSLPLGQAA